MRSNTKIVKDQVIKQPKGLWRSHREATSLWRSHGKAAAYGGATAKPQPMAEPPRSGQPITYV